MKVGHVINSSSPGKSLERVPPQRQERFEKLLVSLDFLLCCHRAAVLLVFTLSLAPRRAVPFCTYRKELKKRRGYGPLTLGGYVKGGRSDRELYLFRSTSTTPAAAQRTRQAQTTLRRRRESMFLSSHTFSVPSVSTFRLVELSRPVWFR